MENEQINPTEQSTNARINFTPPPPIKLHNNKKLFSVIIVLILLAVGGVSAYAYYNGSFVSFPRLLSETIDATKDAKTVNNDTTISVDFSGIENASQELAQLFSGGIGSTEFSITAKSSSDTLDPENPKLVSLITFRLGSISAEAEIRMIDKTIYARLTKAPVLGFLPLLGSYEGKWYFYTYKNEDSQTLDNLDNPFSTLYGIDGNLKNKLTPEQEERLYKMFKDAHLIKMADKLTAETIGGEFSYHFSFDIDREGIVSYLQVLKEYINEVGKNDSALSSFDPTSINESLDKIKDFKGEIWIGQKDKLLHKLNIGFGIGVDETKPEEQVKIKFVSIWSDWNKPVTVVAPEGGVSFETLVSAAFGDASQKGKEASIKANLSLMRAQAELFYDSKSYSYAGFCSSSEATKTRQDIEKSGSTEFVCKDQKMAWAAGAKFPGDAGYWCSDSTGFSQATKSNPTGTVCPE